MLTPRQRAYLRGLANREPVIIQVGKAGITGALSRQLEEALAARELVKLRVLKGAPLEPQEAARQLALATGAEVVQVLGRVVTLYRPSPERPRIRLPAGGATGEAGGVRTPERDEAFPGRQGEG